MLTLTIGFASCSSDDNTVTPTPTPNPQTEAYVWGTEGAIKTCNHLLFTSGKEDANGTEIGNLSLIHISEPTRREWLSRMPSSA